MPYALLFTISGILISVFCFLIAIILLKHGKTFLHKIWAVFNLFVALWGVGCIFIGLSQSKESAILWWKFATVFGFLIPTLFYHTTLVFRGKPRNRLLYVAYLYAIIWIVLNSIFLGDTRFMTVDRIFGSLYFPQSSSILCLTFILIWFFYAIVGNLDLIQHYKIVSGQERNKTLYFSASMLIGFLGGSMNPLTILGLKIYPYGNFSIPIYSAIVAYAFLKHELADIKIVIQKGVIYSILITTVSIFYLLTVFILEKFVQSIFGYHSLAISISAAFSLGLFFVPLKNKIQRFVDRHFFKGTQEEIALQNVQLRQEIVQSEKYKTLSTLASGVAHEVKNPLTAIKTFCEYLPQKLDDKEFLLKFSKLVGREVDRIDGMVHELLDYGKPGPLSLKETGIHKLLQDTLNTLSNQFIKNRIEVIQHLSPFNYHLNIDANRVKQALLNLFLNAIEAMPSGGKLTVTTRIKGGSSNPVFEISIQDTGCGIAAKDLPHIFDPFFTKTDHGTGLGLTITRGIIEQHGGKVSIRSQVGVGTEVILEFPYSD